MAKTPYELLETVTSLVERDLALLAAEAPDLESIDDNATVLLTYSKILGSIVDREALENANKATLLAQMDVAQLLASLPIDLRTAYELSLKASHD